MARPRKTRSSFEGILPVCAGLTFMIAGLLISLGWSWNQVNGSALGFIAIAASGISFAIIGLTFVLVVTGAIQGQTWARLVLAVLQKTLSFFKVLCKEYRK